MHVCVSDKFRVVQQSTSPVLLPPKKTIPIYCVIISMMSTHGIVLTREFLRILQFCGLICQEYIAVALLEGGRFVPQLLLPVELPANPEEGIYNT